VKIFFESKIQQIVEKKMTNKKNSFSVNRRIVLAVKESGSDRDRSVIGVNE